MPSEPLWRQWQKTAGHCEPQFRNHQLALGATTDRNNAKCGAKVATSTDREGQTCRRVEGMCADVITLPHVQAVLWV